MHVDVTRAYSHADAGREIYVRLPAKGQQVGGEDICGKPTKIMCCAWRSTQLAAEVLYTVRDIGFVTGALPHCHFLNKEWQARSCIRFLTKEWRPSSMSRSHRHEQKMQESHACFSGPSSGRRSGWCTRATTSMPGRLVGGAESSSRPRYATRARTGRRRNMPCRTAAPARGGDLTSVLAGQTGAGRGRGGCRVRTRHRVSPCVEKRLRESPWRKKKAPGTGPWSQGGRFGLRPTGGAICRDGGVLVGGQAMPRR